MMQDRFPAGSFDAVRGHAERSQQLFILGRQDEMVDPFKKVGAGLVAHPPGQLAPETVALQERIHAFPQKFFRVKRQRPVEWIIHSDTISDKQ